MSYIYSTFPKEIFSLITNIQEWEIGLPDLQRPYIREKKDARNLIDSLYIWYPTGTILLLENETHHKTKTIWTNDKIQKRPRYVVIDWQQRLTSLFAIITWESIIKKNSKLEQIIISFNPIEEKFEVANSSTEKWIEWIYDIKEVLKWSTYQVTKVYLEKNNHKKDDYENFEETISARIDKLKNILKTSFNCIWISKDVSLDQVSEIFLRINNQWKKLNNADFILTLMSVYWEEWRGIIENFSLYTKKQKDILEFEADDIIRILIGVGLYRAKLEDAYKFLKRNGEEFPDLLSDLDYLTNNHHRKNFLNIFKWMWFIDQSLFRQKATTIACYIFYIIWTKKFSISFPEISKLIQKYFIRTYLGSKYVSSWETTLEKDLKEIQKCNKKQDFIDYLNIESNSYLNDDARNIQLLRSINTSSSLNSIFVTYIASQIYYNKKILFNDTTLTSYFLSKGSSSEKKEIDHHHIFPRNFLLESFWMENIDTTQINQIANKVYCYNTDNKIIWAKSPREYVSYYKSVYGDIKVNESLKENDIHERFYEMSYDDFLEDRQKRILISLKKYVAEISDPLLKKEPIEDSNIILSQWENYKVEFKSSFRWSLNESIVADHIKHQVIKTIAAFLNSDGWTLFIWVDDNGNVIWLLNDINSYKEKTIDSFLKDIDNTLKNHFSNQYANIRVKIIKDNLQNKEYCLIKVEPWTKATYITYSGKEEFYIRRSASSIALTLSETQSYISDHF